MFYGSVQGVRLWEEMRRDKTRCGVLAYDGIVYFLYYELDAASQSAAKPLTETDSGLTSSSNDIASASDSAAEPVQGAFSGQTRTRAVASFTCSSPPSLFAVDELEGISECLGGHF